MNLSKQGSEDRTRSLVQDSVGTTLTNGMLTVLGILVWIAIARFLDPTWRGALALIMIVPATVMKIGTVGFDYGIVVLGGKNKAILGALTRTAIFFGFILGMAFMAVFLGFMFAFPVAFWRFMQKVWLPDPFFLISLTFPIHLMTMAYDAAIYAEDRISVRNAKELTVNFVMLLVILIAVIEFNLRLFGIIGAYLLANIVSLLYGWLVIRGRIDLAGPVRFDLLRSAIAIGFPVYLAQLASFIVLPVMMLILSLQLPDEAGTNLARIAFFVMGYQMVDRMLPVTRSIGFALLPKITGESDEVARKLAAKAGHHTLLVSLIIFGILVILARPLILILLGSSYLPIVGAFSIMAPGGVALSVGGVWANHLLARNRQYKVAWAGLAGTGTALILAMLGFALIPQGREVLVASVAVTVGGFVYSMVLLNAFCSETLLSAKEALVPGKDDLLEWRRIPAYIINLIRRKSMKGVGPQV